MESSGMATALPNLLRRVMLRRGSLAVRACRAHASVYVGLSSEQVQSSCHVCG